MKVNLNLATEKNTSECIKRLLKEKNAAVIAHYYVHPDIQDLADETGGYVGDSLGMARFGSASGAKILVVAGVRFMGETAKILSPHKTILMQTLTADCSLDFGCPQEEFSKFCKEHPSRKVVVYANTSATIKSMADWMVTSSNAVPIVRHLHERGEKILWASDRYLGSYIQKETGADMLIWSGSCIVHDKFHAAGIMQLKKLHPGAAVLVHPESPAGVVELADVVGSTSQLIAAVTKLPNEKFIVATERGILHKMRQLAPGKEFVVAPTEDNGCNIGKDCATCPWMVMNTLEGIEKALIEEKEEIIVPAELARKALVPITRMLDFCGQV